MLSSRWFNISVQVSPIWYLALNPAAVEICMTGKKHYTIMWETSPHFLLAHLMDYAITTDEHGPVSPLDCLSEPFFFLAQMEPVSSSNFVHMLYSHKYLFKPYSSAHLSVSMPVIYSINLSTNRYGCPSWSIVFTFILWWNLVTYLRKVITINSCFSSN